MNTDAVRSLYRTLIDRWNVQDAGGFATCFADDGTSVGFDGSTVTGRGNIAAHLAEVFADHKTATYVAAVRDVRDISSDVMLLRAVVGMVPPGADDLNPDANAIQSLVAHLGDEGWRIILFQNTPAAFHGRPDEVAALTDELRALRNKTTAKEAPAIATVEG